MSKYRTRILDYVSNVTAKIRNPDRSTHEGKILWGIYIWQEIYNYSEKHLAFAWKQAQDNAIVPEDDKLREVQGSRAAAMTPSFVVMVKVDASRMTLNEELFIDNLVKKYKLDKAELLVLALGSRKASKPVLTKRVVERTKE